MESHTSFLEAFFFLGAFGVLCGAAYLRTETHESSALNGLYAPILILVAIYVCLFFARISLNRFVAYSAAFSIVLSAVPLIKYRFLWGGDVNYMYRVILSVTQGSTYDVVQQLPSSMHGIYNQFPAFAIWNAVFIKISGLPVLEGYKVLFAIAYGILYPVSFYVLSKLITNSNMLRRSLVMVSVIPYSLLPGQIWNYYLMPLVIAFLLFLLILSRALTGALTLSSSILISVLMTALILTHPFVSLHALVLMSIVLIIKSRRTAVSSGVGGTLTYSLIFLGWTTLIMWWSHSVARESFLSSVAFSLFLALSESFALPVVTQRLQEAGPLTFIVTHIAKVLIGLLFLLGVWSILRRKLPENLVQKSAWWILALLFLYGLITFVPVYALYDIFVAYRSLFFIIVVLTVGAGLGIHRIAGSGGFTFDIPRTRKRSLLAGSLLFLILTASMFELYPTEYLNPTVRNATHDIYEKNSIDFLNAFWPRSKEIVVDTYTYHVAQAYGSVMMFDNVVSPLRLRQVYGPSLLVISSPGNSTSGVTNAIYSSGKIAILSTIP